MLVNYVHMISIRLSDYFSSLCGGSYQNHLMLLILYDHSLTAEFFIALFLFVDVS